MANYPKTLIVDIQWAKYYRGDSSNDPIKREVSTGIEVLGEEKNFLVRSDNKVYGYIPCTPNKATYVHFEKAFGGEFEEKSQVDGVRVVFVASNAYCNNPDVNFKGHTIVGWYNNATVYPEAIEYKIDGDGLYYHVVADPKNVYLLDEEDRPQSKHDGFQPIPAIRGGQRWGIGQYKNYPIYYHDYTYSGRDDQEPFRDIPKLVNEYIDEKQKTLKPIAPWTGPKIKPNNAPKISGPGHQSDLIKKLETEKNAVQATIDYYRDELGVELVSVEKENVGWDLEGTYEYKEDGKDCRKGCRVEVKGTTSSSIQAELTPNEYKKLQETVDGDIELYEISVVTNCLDEDEITVHIFTAYYDEDSEEYCGEGYNDDENTKGKILRFEEKTGAKCFAEETL